MALVGVLALCCLSSSASAGGFFGGLIPGTEPHFLKVTQADKMKEIVDGELCKVVKENTNTEGNFNGKSALSKYSSSVFTLNGSKNKKDLFEQYVGIGPGPNQISNGKLPETIGLCVASDEDFEKYMEMFK